jgi:hypothetical protein
LLSEDDTTPRLQWIREAQTIDPSTWQFDNRLKYSEKEMRARALRGDQIVREAQERFPIGDLTGDDAMRQYDRQKAAMNEQHLLLGCKGTPVFAKLSYFRYETTA